MTRVIIGQIVLGFAVTAPVDSTVLLVAVLAGGQTILACIFAPAYAFAL